MPVKRISLTFWRAMAKRSEEVAASTSGSTTMAKNMIVCRLGIIVGTIIKIT